MRTNHIATRFWHLPAVRRTRHIASPVLWYRYLTAERRRLPAFIIAGAQKAGTTSLYRYLKYHPQCAPPLTKEVHYFDRNFSRGESWYRMHFALAEPGENGSPTTPAPLTCFESSPYYMFDPRVPQRIRQSMPNVKVIFLLRNPLNRAYSHFHHSVRRGRERLSFEEAIAAEPLRLTGQHERLLVDAKYQSAPHKHHSYLARGIYADQLDRWRRHFPAEQLHVIQAERMFKQPQEVFSEVIRFLGFDSWTPAEFGNHYSGRYKDPMLPETRKRLADYFAPHNERLFESLGVRYDWA
jgi:hypothetical protein